MIYHYNSRYKNLKQIKDTVTGKLRLETFPDIDIPISDDDLYIEVKKDIKLDKIANEFYGDPSLYWIILISNYMKHPWDFGNRKILRIPRYRENIMSLL